MADFICILVSLILLVVPAVINLLEHRKVTRNNEDKSTSYKTYYIDTVVIYTVMSILISWRLNIILKNIRKAFGEDFAD